MMTKRILSMLLILTMVFGLIPVTAQAEEAQTAVDNGAITVEGTNGFGTLLAEDIADQQEQMEAGQNSGYTLTDLEITGNIATVTYDSLEEATVLVAIYTEDGMQMLTSGKTTVTPEETTATVTIEGEMPQYFMASAYLLDSYDLSPLCPAYDTPMYTKEMQELLASTADDYDPELVLQLDENNKETNFAVYAETTKVIEYMEGVNTLTIVDEHTYIIENADDSFTSLQVGDIFAYTYGENEVLISKVANIEVSGTTVTITGGDVETEEAFSHIKIDADGNDQNAIVDASTADEGVTYLGEVSPYAMRRAVEGGDTITKSKVFSLDKAWEAEDDNGLSVSVSVSGSLTFKADVGMYYYLSWKKKIIRIQVDLSATASATLKGSINKTIKLGDIEYPIIPEVLEVGLEPKLVLKYSGEVTFTATLSATVGIEYTKKNGVTDISTAPHLEHDFNAEMTIYVGLDLGPKVEVANDWLVELSFQAEAGVELHSVGSGTFFDKEEDGAKTRHTCTECLKMDLTGKITLSGKIKFLKKEKYTYPIDIGEYDFDITPMYWSLDHDELGFGECPHLEYLVTFEVRNLLEGNEWPLSDIDVTADGNYLGTTNKHGVFTAYLPLGRYDFEANFNGQTCSVFQNIAPDDIHVRFLFRSGGTTGSTTTTGKPGILGGIDASVSDMIGIVDRGVMIASGNCGENVTWKLYDNGVLHIYGSGKMENYYSSQGYHPPWYSYRKTITSIVIHNGVTNISHDAFDKCTNLMSVEIPQSVTYVDTGVFYDCTSLTSITIPNRVTSIGDYVFTGCTKLSNITISDSVTYIGAWSFERCASLTDVYYSGTQAQWKAINIGRPNTPLFNATIHFMGDVVASGDNGYGNIFWKVYDEGKTLEISGTGEMMPGNYHYWAWGGPWSNYASLIERVIIREGITDIVNYGFSFDNYENIKSISIPYSVTKIASDAFENCTNLTDIYYSGTQSQWNAITIGSDNDPLFNATIHYNSAAPLSQVADSMAVSNSLSGVIGESMSSSSAIFGGEYNTEITDSYTVKTADFSDLAPGKEYVLLAMVSLDVDDPMSGDNLLFVDQGVAGEDGTLSFRYVQRVDAPVSYVMACGASTKDLKDAQITFPRMISDGETQVVEPTVVYDGKTLTLGQDYILAGDVDFTEAGQYSCYIRGIYAYTGLVTCPYTVTTATAPTITLKYPTLTFEDVILMNVYFAAENLEDVEQMGLITYSQSVSEWNVENAEAVVPGYTWSEADGFYYATTNGIAAKDLGDEIYFAVYAKLTDGSYTYSRLVPYSPRTYAYASLSTGSDAMKSIVVAMLNYGAAAQTFFDYKTDTPVNNGLTDAQKALAEDYRADMIAAVASPDATKQGGLVRTSGFSKMYPTVSFEGAFCINYYCTASATPADGITMYYWNQEDYDANPVLTLDNATAAIPMTPDTATGQYNTTVAGIAAKDLDKGVYVCFVYTNGTDTCYSGVLAYSIGTYCATQAGGTGASADLAKATAVYGYYANLLFNK